MHTCIFKKQVAFLYPPAGWVSPCRLGCFQLLGSIHKNKWFLHGNIHQKQIPCSIGMSPWWIPFIKHTWFQNGEVYNNFKDFKSIIFQKVNKQTWIFKLFNPSATFLDPKTPTSMQCWFVCSCFCTWFLYSFLYFCWFDVGIIVPIWVIIFS